MKIDFSKANDGIREWTVDVKGKLKEAMINLGIRHRSYSQSKKAATESLSHSFRQGDGLINRISYNIPRHMIFVHKGVGKDTPISKQGSTNRKAKPWFNPVIEENINDLADTVAEEMGSAIINNLLIK